MLLEESKLSELEPVGSFEKNSLDWGSGFIVYVGRGVGRNVVGLCDGCDVVGCEDDRTVVGSGDGRNVVSHDVGCKVVDCGVGDSIGGSVFGVEGRGRGGSTESLHKLVGFLVVGD